VGKRLLGELELNRIYQRDCIEGMGLIPDKSIDMILCDLPYGTTACKWDTIIPFEPLWEQYERIIKDNGAIALFSQQPFSSQLIVSNPKLFKYELIWDKMIGGAFVLAKKRPLPKHENILVFYKKAPTYNPQMTDADPKNIRPVNKGTSQSEALPVAGGVAKSAKDYDNKKRYPTSVLSYSSKMAECNSLNRLHPTQKPVALFEYLVKTYTNEGDIVLDNCMGSGTTAVAATQLNRDFIGFETEQEYVRIANQRLESVVRGSSLQTEVSE
jgi:site-specific DNA-methyltransferase (adenine-specific)